MRPIPAAPFEAHIEDEQTIHRLRFLQHEHHKGTGEHIGAGEVVRLLLIESGWMRAESPRDYAGWPDAC